MTVSHALEVALKHHKAGQFQEAERIYRHVLETEPNSGDAMGLLAALALQFGRNDVAAELIAKTSHLQVSSPATFTMLGAAYRSLGRCSEAEIYFRKAISLDPDLAEAHSSLGDALRNLGRLEEAECSYRRVLALAPGIAEAHYNVGLVLADLGRSEEAERSYREALALKPDLAEAHNNLGNVLRGLGRLEDAERCYCQVLALKPDFAGAHTNLGIVLSDLGRLEEAERCFRRALTLTPHSAESHFVLGNALRIIGHLDEAERSYCHALTLKPDYAEAHNNLGNVLRDLGRLGEAERTYHGALTFRPDYAEAHGNLGNVLKDLGRLEEAEQSYRIALKLKPDYAEAHGNLGNMLMGLGRLGEAERSYRQALMIKADFPGVHSNLLLTLNCVPGRSPADIYAEHREFERRYGKGLDCPPHRNIPDPERKLRIGYVSGDFRDHSVAFFIEPVLAKHDKRGFEIFCYHNFPKSDAVTQRLKSYADHWREVFTLNDEALAKLIREDAVDILLDLSGHAEKNRLLVFARRPAPVQATWLGYLNTTGLQAMDYRITDSCASPEGTLDDYHSEKLIRLPNSQWCYRPPTEYPDVEQLPKATSGSATFAAFTSPAKVNLQVIELWSRLLRLVPGSRLLVINSGLALVPTEYFERFTRRGIPKERLQLMGSRSFQEYLSLHSSADVVLDTFPYTGGTTTCHALWMGVPVVSLAGDTATSRGGSSLLHAVGLGELVAETPDEYLEIAAGLVRDTDRLAALRAGLRERTRASPLMDAQRFTRNLENAYRTVWRTWCERRTS